MVKLDLTLKQRNLLKSVAAELPPLDQNIGPWVAGGVVRNIAIDSSLDDMHDIDVFFVDYLQAQKFEESLLEMGYETNECSTEKCHTLCHILTAFPHTQFCCQVVLGRFHDSMESVTGSFSITACQFITDGESIWAEPNAVADAKSRRFVLVNKQRLSPSFLNKYLKNYGYVYDGPFAELQELVDENLKGWSGDVPADMMGAT